MIKLNLNYNSFTYPWEKISLQDRLNKLFQKGKKNIVYIFPLPNYTTFRYRVYNMCEILNENKKMFATYFFMNELDVVLKHFDLIDCIVMVRTEWNIWLDKIFCKSYAKGIKVYFDIDDLFFDITKVPLLLNTINAHMTESTCDLWISLAAKYHLTAKYSNSYICTNSYLAKELSDLFSKPSYVVPNFLNYQQMEASNAIWKLKKKQINNDQILLGYFGGTNTHNNDFNTIIPDLIELLDKNKNIKLRMVGHIKLPEYASKYISKDNVEYYPIQNYLDLQVKIAECDINLIPLVINEFTHCKSELKYFEAAIVGTLSIASPTFIYKQIIKDNENGYLAMPGEWGKKIESILQNNNRSVIDAARSFVEEEYFGTKILTKLEALFE